jgi:hypothetical protein
MLRIAIAMYVYDSRAGQRWEDAVLPRFRLLQTSAIVAAELRSPPPAGC